MRLPHLDQYVPLELGEAGLLARALALPVQEVTTAQRPVPYVEMLIFASFCNLGKELLKMHRREQLTSAQPNRCPKLRQLHVPYAALAPLRAQPLQFL